MKSARRNAPMPPDDDCPPDVADRVRRRLVATVLLARTALYTSTLMAALITGLGWLMTDEPVFIGCFTINAVIGLVRARMTVCYQKLDFETIDSRVVLSHDRSFLAWSTAFAANIGLTCFCLIMLSDEKNGIPLAVTVCVGYAVAFMTRSSGRLRLAVYQIVAMSVPPVCLLLAIDKPDSLKYAALCAAAAVSSIAMACSTYRKSLALCVADENNRRMARHDMLTGLPNRYAMTEALDAAAQSGNGGGKPFAVMTVDIDRFKEINDTLGHSTGDAVIVATGRRLADLVDRDDFVARLGGDEFVVMTLGASCDRARARALGERINAELAKPLVHEGHTIVLSASIGVSLFPEHGVTKEDLLQRADIALYEVKRHRRNQTCIFDADMQTDLNERRWLDAELRTAVACDQFEAWYQPIVNMKTGDVVGYEALARWRHPCMGLVQPGRFIAAAERTDAIFAIGKSILDKACHEAATWPHRLTLAVNISTVEFRRPTELVASIKGALLASGLDPHRLYIEITESVLLNDSDEARRAIAELVQFGVRISLDDFGTGYSSLSYVQDLPFSTIKIDKKFIDHVDNDRKSRAIVTSIAALAAGLDMKIVAEGVEAPAQAKALRDLGVMLAQGYLYGRPQPRPMQIEPKKIAC